MPPRLRPLRRQQGHTPNRMLILLLRSITHKQALILLLVRRRLLITIITRMRRRNNSNSSSNIKDRDKIRGRCMVVWKGCMATQECHLSRYVHMYTSFDSIFNHILMKIHRLIHIDRNRVDK